MMSYDLIIIGSGPGGYKIAVAAAQAGKQVAVIERGHLGGTCLNAGCIPTKTLCRSAEVADLMHESADYGITLPEGTPMVNLPTVIERKNQIVQTLRDAIAGLMRTPGITLIHGQASFQDAHTLKVVQSEGEELLLTSPVIFIATGSVSKALPVPGTDLPGVMDAEGMLNATELPRHLCIIGGGVIGLEFASVFRSFGSEVTVVEYAPEVLPRFDKDMAKRLRTALKRKGIVFHVSAAVTAISDCGSDGLEVHFSRKGNEETVACDRVLMAVGRGARLEGLHLEAAGIAYTPRGIQVDENMQTSQPGVYAIGDCNGMCQLAHAATYQSYRALNHVLGKTDTISFDIMPAAVFTVPELATVGLTEEECRERGLQVEIRKTGYRSNGKALAEGAEDGIVKQIYDSHDGKLLGAHILGAHAADLIHEATLQMHASTTRNGLHDMIHAHPTLSELLA